MPRAPAENAASSFVPALVHPGEAPEDAWFFLARGLDLVLRREGERLVVPRLAERAAMGGGEERLHFLGWLDGRACFTSPLPEGRSPALPYEQVPARSLFGAVDEAMLDVAGRAVAIAEWDANHRFCGRCGVETALDATERSRRCPRCRTPFYPRLSPAIIVLVEREDSVLLARAAAFPRPFFSTLAGFVEPGESLEACVHREVREEVGIELRDLRYFGSQPWPFGRSLMIGYFASYARGEIQVDGTEILEASWFRRDALPLLPPHISIARKLIEEWRGRGG